jgi:hypothetical protein
MPTYLFKNKETGETFEKWMYMADRETYLAENPNITQLPVSLRAVSAIGDFQNKVDGDFKSLINKISKIPGSTVDHL